MVAKLANNGKQCILRLLVNKTKNIKFRLNSIIFYYQYNIFKIVIVTNVLRHSLTFHFIKLTMKLS